MYLYPFYLYRKHLFYLYRKKYLNLSSLYKEKIDTSCYDVIITGSDQTFNLNYPFAKTYYQPFRKRESQKKIAYAPSFGSYDISLLPKEMENFLKDFDSLSCRESSGAVSLSNKIDKPVNSVFDPVFLLSKKKWEAVLNARPLKDGYVFVYDLNGKDNLVKFALNNCKGKPVVVYSNDLMFQIRYKKNSNISFIKCLSVDDFLSYIYFADYVFTDSFHGTAFSIIFEKQFYTYIALNNAANRIYNLLDSLKLRSRIVETNAVDCSIIDYTSVLTRLNYFVLNSQNYLKQNDL